MRGSDVGNHTYTFSYSSDEERMVEDCIRSYGFLEDITSKKGKVLTLFENGTGIQEKSNWRGPILFEDLGVEIQDKNNPKRVYLVNIRIGNVPYIGSVVSHVKSPSIILLNKIELV